MGKNESVPSAQTNDYEEESGARRISFVRLFSFIFLTGKIEEYVRMNKCPK